MLVRENPDRGSMESDNLLASNLVPLSNVNTLKIVSIVHPTSPYIIIYKPNSFEKCRMELNFQFNSFYLKKKESQVSTSDAKTKTSTININDTTKGIDLTRMAVEISSGYKSYGKYKVLKNLNLNVPTGAIYGLLGPSGCGE